MTPVFMRQLPYDHCRPEPVILPYSPEPYDRCARCEGTPIVATAHHVSHWLINICDKCLTEWERAEMRAVIDGQLGQLEASGREGPKS